MKKLFTLLSVVILSGCTHAVPLHPEFPKIPPALEQDCGKLLTLQDNAKLSDLMITITMNYMKFHECERKNQAWRDWYATQKQIYENATKK